MTTGWAMGHACCSFTTYNECIVGQPLLEQGIKEVIW